MSQPDFEQVMLPQLDAAYNLARWLLRNDQDAEDAVQEACLRAHKAFGRFRGGDGKAWFMTILRNVCYSMMRSLKKQESPESFDEEIHLPADANSPASTQPDISAENLNLALEKLPLEFREVIVLHDLEGLAYREIAAIADIPMGTVMSRLARARGRLREEMIRLNAKDFSK